MHGAHPAQVRGDREVGRGDAKAEAACSVALAARRRIDAMFAADSRFDGMAAAGDFEGRRSGASATCAR